MSALPLDRLTPTSPVRAAHVAKHAALFAGAAAIHVAFPLAQRPDLDDPALATAGEAVRRRFVEALADDASLAEDGVVPPRAVLDLPWRHYLKTLPSMLWSRRDNHRRRDANAWRALPDDVDTGAFPPYYRRTFHWQQDGYLSDRSAAIYDIGVEVLFLGAADVMRRALLTPLVAERQRLGRPLDVLDVACGTGRTLAMAHDATPDSKLTGVDLSPWYVRAARRQLGHIDPLSLLVGRGEDLPLQDDTFDVVTSTFLFHELPRSVRRDVMRELVRVLRPGGLLVVVDSAQRTDSPELGPILDAFPGGFHEPYYGDYLRDELADIATEAGAQAVGVRQVYLAKRVSARKPA